MFGKYHNLQPHFQVAVGLGVYSVWECGGKTGVEWIFRFPGFTL